MYLCNENVIEKLSNTSTTDSFVSNDRWYFSYDTATNEFGIIIEYGGISKYFKPEDRQLIRRPD